MVSRGENKCVACGEWSGKGHKCRTPNISAVPSTVSPSVRDLGTNHPKREVLSPYEVEREQVRAHARAGRFKCDQCGQFAALGDHTCPEPVLPMPDQAFLDTAPPVEFDTALAQVYDTKWRQDARDAGNLDSIHYALGERRNSGARKSNWPTSPEEAIQRAIEEIGKPDIPSWKSEDIVTSLTRHANALSKARSVRSVVTAYNSAFTKRGGWSRFFLVTNANGHIHKDFDCSTCRPTTQYAWLPNLSGLTEKDAVDDQGTRLCSVCYPSAPVEWTVGLTPEEDPSLCVASGKSIYYSYKGASEGMRRQGMNNAYVACPECSKYVPVNVNTGNIRKHKREGA